MKHINLNKTVKTLALVTASLSLTACFQMGQAPTSQPDLSQPEFRRNHPIVVKKSKAEINLVMSRTAKGMSPNQTATAAQFVLDYMDKGEGYFEIWRPRGHLNTNAVNIAHQKVRRILSEAAIPATAIQYHKYDAYGDDGASLGLKFDRYYATASKCGDFSKNVAQNFKNENYANFGCSQQNNIAKMVSNPKDLLGPERLSNASAERRQIIWAKYIQGSPTGATRSGEEKVTISEVAK